MNLVERFGEPESLLLLTDVEKGIGGSSRHCSSCEEWEPSPNPVRFSSALDLYYPSQGLVFGVSIPLTELGCICPEMQVSSFTYYAPMSIQEVLHRYCPIVHQDTGCMVDETDLVDWHGFGGGY